MKKPLIECALGNIAADMLITGVNVFHLSDGTLEQCDIAIYDGKIAGLFSNLSMQELNSQLEELALAAKSTGCTLSDPFQQISFLALPVIPHLKLTDQGLFDVDIFKHIEDV